MPLNPALENVLGAQINAVGQSGNFIPGGGIAYQQKPKLAGNDSAIFAVNNTAEIKSFSLGGYLPYQWSNGGLLPANFDDNTTDSHLPTFSGGYWQSMFNSGNNLVVAPIHIELLTLDKKQISTADKYSQLLALINEGVLYHATDQSTIQKQNRIGLTTDKIEFEEMPNNFLDAKSGFKAFFKKAPGDKLLTYLLSSVTGFQLDVPPFSVVKVVLKVVTTNETTLIGAIE